MGIFLLGLLGEGGAGYGVDLWRGKGWKWKRLPCRKPFGVVGAEGFEPPTLCL